MRNMFLIARREYLERVRSKSFLFMTIFIPALMLGATVLPTLIAMRSSGGPKHVLVAASDRQTAELIRKQLQKPDDPDAKVSGLEKPSGSAASRYQVDVDTDVSESARSALTEKVKQKQLDGVIWASDDALAANKLIYITRDVANLNETVSINQVVSRAVHRRLLQKRGLSDAEIDTALKPVDMDLQNPLGNKGGSPLVAFFTVLAMVMILYMTVLLYGINVMRAVLEEKTSRIMEVMLSTASASDMMAGKILGVGAVGLTQVGIWAATTAIINGAGLAGAGLSGMLKGVISLEMAIFFPVFFLLGFALYSTLCAAVGAMVNSEQEAQQMQFIVMMPMIASVIILVTILQNPGSPLAFWASIFPLTAPLIMFTRIALEPTPAWHIALSIALLVATIYGVLVLCGRIYRIGILMYGKKPTLPEIMKWIKYA